MSLDRNIDNSNAWSSSCSSSFLLSDLLKSLWAPTSSLATEESSSDMTTGGQDRERERKSDS